MKVYEERVATLLVLLDAEFDVHELPTDWTAAERLELMRVVLWSADEEVRAWAELARRPRTAALDEGALFRHAVNWGYRRHVFEEALALDAEPRTEVSEDKRSSLYDLVRRTQRRPRS